MGYSTSSTQRLSPAGLATDLLACLKSNITSDLYGIMSSHLAVIMAIAPTFRFGNGGINLDSVRVHSRNIFRAAPMPYVPDAKLRGLLFEGFDALTGIGLWGGYQFLY